MKHFVLFVFITLSCGAIATDFVIIDSQSTWKYLDDGSDLGTAWYATAYDDSNWASGPAKLGFGDNDNNTTINNHQSPTTTGATTWYFRKTFNIQNVDDFDRLKFEVLRDDGAVVYLNGVELGRSNMPSGTIDHQTLAASTVSGAGETRFYPSSIFDNTLQVGDNVIAVEVHQRQLTSSDVAFDLRLLGTQDNLIRGPYLQNQSAITIKWRTFEAVSSRVFWGPAYDQLNNEVNSPDLTTDHEVRLTGLTPGDTLYYSIGSGDDVYAGGDAAHRLKMPKNLGHIQPLRIWVLGDSGTGNANAAAVKDAYLAHTGSTHTDLWLMLGDNAYNTGTDDEYQAAVFDMYPELLRSSALWSTIGNHDRANSILQTGIYYDIFTFPTQAQSDGISTGTDSGTEAYYSFDYANVHFVVLESHETNSTFRNGMINWLNNDLMMTDADWIIALWHHPPYSKGSHDSDTESRMVYVRENILQTLEGHGVDLVLTGHSHSYERSWLIDGHYGHSDTFDHNIHLIDGSDGTPNTTPYQKPYLGTDPNNGAVYVVSGSSGKISGNQGEAHEAMRNLLPVSELGSLIIDVHHDVMDVQFLQSNGQITDAFQILKGDVIFYHGFDD